MELFHPLNNRDYQKLNSIFSFISFLVAQKLERNATFDERGLNDLLFDYILENLKLLNTAHYFINLEVKKPDERKTGADIVFRVNVIELVKT